MGRTVQRGAARGNCAALAAPAIDLPNATQHRLAMRFPAEVADKVVAAAVSAGVGRDALFAAAGLEPAAPLAYPELCRLYEKAALLTGDGAFGLHVGERTEPSMYGLLGYAAAHSATLGEALDHLVAFQQVWSDAVAFVRAEEADRLRLIYAARRPVPPEARRHESEQMMSAVLTFARLTTGAEVRPLLVRLEHARPDDTGEHRRVFRCRTVFAAPTTELVLARADLSRPLAQADLTLGALIRRQAASDLARRTDRAPLVEEAARVVERMLAAGEGPRLAEAARSLGLGPRTLQRRLADSGASWRSVVEEVRMAKAAALLADGRRSLAEVAFRTGYADASAFHRAFRRRLGTTPREHRLTAREAPKRA
jgi:AraC-like DNA-binding protein